MRKLAHGLTVFIFLLSIQNLLAQRCGSMEHLHEQLQQDPDMAARMQLIEQQTAAYVANPQNHGSRAIITIPVVVHVVYNTTAQNVSNAQIQSQIDRLNLDYHKLNTDWTSTPSVWQSLVADYEIQFCLASRDPNGNATTGIIRKQTSSTSFSTNDNVKRTANGGDDAWPASSYLNLWVCNLSGGVLGYAQFPGGAAATDGVVITYTGFGSTGTAQAPYNLGRTATHEVGHWLNLYHIWGDDGSGCNGSDQVGDTPNQGSEHYGCPSFPSVSCSNGPNGDMWMNYMDYTDDRCMYMFTNGQKTRSLSLFATGGARVGLLTSLGCQSINTPPVANFTADVTSSCTGIIRFTDASTNSPTSWLWNFGDGTTSTTQSPTHTYTANGSYTVTLTATNGFGSNVKTLTNYITVTKPAAPAATDASHCGTGTFTLTTTSTNPVAWLDSSGNLLSSSATFVTPSINHTTTYWVQDTVGASQYHVGPANNSGSGGYLTQAGSNWALIFNVNTACVLQSVYVYSGSTGAVSRTFELRNSAGTLVQSATVSVPAGGSRVTLNFNLATGTGYKLQLSSSSTINLYRNNAGATYPYTDAGGYVSITGNSATNVPTYYYFFYDWIIQGNGCVSERRAVNAVVSAGLNASTTVVNASCGSSNGSASVAVSGGTPTYTYHWNTGATGTSISNLAANTYSVTVTDVNNCSGSASAVVTSASSLTNSKTSTNVTCYGGNNGSGSVTVLTGTPNFTYAWSNGGSNASINNIAAGTYYVTITDGSSCQKTDSVVITQGTAIDVQVTAADAHCNGETNGSASVTASGGAGNYTYGWSTTGTGSTVSNLAPGNYSVVATDVSGCTGSSSFVVNEPSALSLNTTSTQVSCNGGNNATANVVASGGIGSFTYLWCNGTTTHNTSGLSAGNCAVTVTDDNGCTATNSVTVQEPTAMQLNTNSTMPDCFGLGNGTATITGAGGTGGYTYLWCNGDTSQTTNGLSAGSCSVTVTDGNGCTAVTSAAVQQPSQIVITTSTNTNGSASVDAVSGGTAPYTYSWSNGEHTQTVTGLATGNYIVTVMDNHGCSSTAGVSVVVSGIIDLQTIAFSVYPNPASGILTIALSQPMENTTFSIKNVLGQTVLSGNINATQTVIDLQRFINGVYFVEVKQGGSKTVKEVLVNK